MYVCIYVCICIYVFAHVCMHAFVTMCIFIYLFLLCANNWHCQTGARHYSEL